MLEASIAAGAGRFIHTSSFTTWGFIEGEITEESTRSRNSDWINYVHSKKVAEELVKEAVEQDRIEAVILNPGHILGPGDRHNWSQMVTMVATETLPGMPPVAERLPMSGKLLKRTLPPITREETESTISWEAMTSASRWL